MEISTPKVLTIVMYNDGDIHYLVSDNSSIDESIHMMEQVTYVMKHEERN